MEQLGSGTPPQPLPLPTMSSSTNLSVAHSKKLVIRESCCPVTPYEHNLNFQGLEDSLPDNSGRVFDEFDLTLEDVRVSINEGKARLFCIWDNINTAIKVHEPTIRKRWTKVFQLLIDSFGNLTSIIARRKPQPSGALSF